jgi:hypothetical protein
MGPALAWCRYHSHVGTPLLFGENVVGLPLGLYRCNLPDYWVQELLVQPHNVGFGLIARERKLILATHKRKVHLTGSWGATYEYICGHLSGVQTTPSSCMLASSDELFAEQLYIARRRGAVFSPCSDWTNLLSENEVVRLRTYDVLRSNRCVVVSPDVVYNLGDNPPTRVTWSVVSNALPTYRKSCTTFWVPAAHRWLTPAEKLCSMGWPVFQELAVSCGTSVLRVPRESASRMVGNAVCLPNIGVALLAGLACCQIVAP